MYRMDHMPARIMYEIMIHKPCGRTMEHGGRAAEGSVDEGGASCASLSRKRGRSHAGSAERPVVQGM